ncbi:WecB/TagA/CpsF family glycosyltransferase [Rhodococcus erythropolis]|uniref:WecB/TagA/CpsF family glycosyltransferase n=1 Tax=Rhodococcus erythropolis TaxID=1833 RepID=UPI003D134050
MSSPFEVIEVGGIPFAATNLEGATDWVVNDRREGAGTGVSVRLSNSYCVSAAHSDRDYSAVLKGPGVNFADGTPVSWVMRLIGGTASDHFGVRPVRGPSFFEATLDKGRRYGLRHHFVGTTEETLSLLTDRVEELYPGIEVAGTYAPPFAAFSKEFVDDIITKVGPSAPDIVWVGLGAPKQDFVTKAIADRTDYVAVGVGAAFDFLAGTVSEAPSFVQNSGFEWLYRLASEPKRLWRRYLFGNSTFVRLASRDIRKFLGRSGGRT